MRRIFPHRSTLSISCREQSRWQVWKSSARGTSHTTWQLGFALALLLPLQAVADEPQAVREVVRPFNGKNLDGLTTWLKSSKHEDPQQVFRVTKEGWLHISGVDRGYVGTREAYRDYHLRVEYKWGERTDGGKYVRNSGVLLHATGDDGNARGVWMTSLEVQLAQGCEGDLIVIRGKDSEGKTVPATISSETVVASDGRTRWKAGGKKTVYQGKQFWWSRHDPAFKELLDTRGKDDVASPKDQWTLVECVCVGDRVTVKINGVTVNECFDVFPAGGRILLQNEGHEVYFRNWELRPLGPRGTR